MATSDDKHPKNASSNPYLKYSGMVFQLFVLLAVAAWLGQWLDEKTGNDTPYFTAALLVISLIGYLVKLGIDLSKS